MGFLPFGKDISELLDNVVSQWGTFVDGSPYPYQDVQGRYPRTGWIDKANFFWDGGVNILDFKNGIIYPDGSAQGCYYQARGRRGYDGAGAIYFSAESYIQATYGWFWNGTIYIGHPFGKYEIRGLRDYSATGPFEPIAWVVEKNEDFTEFDAEGYRIDNLWFNGVTQYPSLSEPLAFGEIYEGKGASGDLLQRAISRTRASAVTGAARSCMTSRVAATASRRLARSSAMVSPCVKHPGRAGTSAQYPPSGSAWTTTFSFMRILSFLKSCLFQS